MATYWENSCSFGLRYVSWYKCLIVSLVFSHLGFWSGNLFLIAPFPDLCLLVPFFDPSEAINTFKGRYYGLYCAISGNGPSPVNLSVSSIIPFTNGSHPQCRSYDSPSIDSLLTRGLAEEDGKHQTLC